MKIAGLSISCSAQSTVYMSLTLSLKNRDYRDALRVVGTLHPPKNCRAKKKPSFRFRFHAHFLLLFPGTRSQYLLGTFSGISNRVWGSSLRCTLMRVVSTFSCSCHNDFQALPLRNSFTLHSAYL